MGNRRGGRNSDGKAAAAVWRAHTSPSLSKRTTAERYVVLLVQSGERGGGEASELLADPRERKAAS